MKRSLLIIVVLLALFLAACSPASTTQKSMGLTTPTAPGRAPAPEIVTPEEMSGGVPTPPTVITTDQQLDVDRMIVRTGNMALVVNDIQQAIDTIAGLAGSFNGYVVSSNIYGQKDRLFGSISIRIPVEHFDETIRALRALAVEVTSETTNSQDVTEEYVDLKSKLKNLEATEAQLLTILAKAEKVEDILAVQRELTNVRGQIEQTKGRMQYLERTSSTSLINVSLQQSSLTVEFNANKTSVKVGEATWFSADVSGGFAPYSYRWDMGDGATSTEAAFSHSYRNEGSYIVKLTVTDDKGNTVEKIRADYITVIPGWSAGNIASSAWNGLVSFGRGLANVFIWLGIFSPVWLVLGAISYGIYWYRRRPKKSQNP